MTDIAGNWKVNIEHGGSFQREYELIQAGDLFAGSGREVWAPPQPAQTETLAGKLEGNIIEATVVRRGDGFGGIYTGELSSDGNKITGQLTTLHDGVQPANWTRL